MKAQCPECSRQYAVSEEMKGRKVRCKCGNVMELGAAAPVTMPVAAPVAAPVAKDEQKILVPCSSCSKVLRVSANAIGKFAKCTCGAQTRITNPQAARTTPFVDPCSTGPSAQPIAVPYSNPGGNPMGVPLGVPFDPYGPAGNDPWKGQGIQTNAPDPLGISNLNYGTELARPPAPIRPRPNPMRTSQSSAKKNKLDGTTIVIGIVQVVLGIILALAAVALFIASFEAEDVKARSYRGMIFLAIFGVGLIANGCRTFMGIADD